MEGLTEQEIAAPVSLETTPSNSPNEHIRKEYMEAFKSFDLNANGHLSTRELKCAMRMLGSNPTDSEVQQLVNEKDYDGDGTLNFKEFVNVMEQHRSLREENDVRTLFSVFDPENNGFTEGRSIKNSLIFLKDIPLHEVNEILVKGKIADDKTIFLEEFWNLLSPLVFKEERHSTEEML